MKEKPKKQKSPEPKNAAKLVPPAADEVEPTAQKKAAPVWLVFAFGVLIFGGEIYLDRHSGDFDKQVYEEFASVKEMKAATPVLGVAGRIENGRQLYANSCAACHQSTGVGNPAVFAPPLAGSEWVQAKDPARMIRIALYGLHEPIQVKGQTYSGGTMTAMGEVFSADKIADILTFVRQEWGNNAPPVTTEQVKEVEQKVGPRSYWTPDELLKIPVE